MKQEEPLVSIILPVHNAGHFLHRCIESLLNQTYRNIEIIVIDDFSKDNSGKILKQLKKLDSRIRVYKNKKRYGFNICFNRALKQTKGTFIAFMDYHDISTLDRVKRQVRYLLFHPKVVAVGTQCISIDYDDKKTAKSTLPQDHQSIIKSLLTGITMQFETAMINKKLLPKDVLYFKENTYPFIYSHVFMKLLPYGELANLPWALYYKRKIFDASTTITFVMTFIKQLLKSIALYEYRPSIRSLFYPLIKQA